MKPKGGPESKLSATQTMTNKKRPAEIQSTGKKLDASMLKKNEFALIILGALLLTIIIFFLFFRSSNPAVDPVKKNVSIHSMADFEKRVVAIEQTLQGKEKHVSSTGNNSQTDRGGMDPIQERVARLETAFLVKFDSLIERMEKIEVTLAQLKNKPVESAAPKSLEKQGIPLKKAVKKEKKAAMFHTVQKGETLYSISKKYNTTIENLRGLNKLSTTATLYPGDNILIR